MMNGWLGKFALCLTVVTLAACSSDGGTDPTPGINLAGNWFGTMVESSADPNPDTLAWTATQSGANVNGAAVLTMMAPTPGDPSRLANGTMTGVVAGTEVTLTFTLPPGSLVAAGAPAGCSVTGTATTTPTETAISATMTRTFSAACIGVVVPTPTDTVQLSLTK
jgi:hypothetical protein